MTYVLGIKRFGTTAIITDSLLTVELKPFRAAAIKSGVLFPGCIYGICGTWHPAWKCIAAIRTACTQGTPAERFEQLKDVIARYTFSPDPRMGFTILLSSRHAGTPDFYIISSTTKKLLTDQRNFIPLGRGAEALSQTCDVLNPTFKSHEMLQTMRRQIAELGDGNVLDEDYAHLYAFTVFQALHGETGRRLRDECGVGGAVHFIFQDCQGERRQKQRLYMVGGCDENGNFTTFGAQRLGFDHDPVFGDLIVATEPVGQPPVRTWFLAIQNSDSRGPIVDHRDMAAWFESMRNKHLVPPLYELAIAGRIDNLRRGWIAPDNPIYLRRWRDVPVYDFGTGFDTDLLGYFREEC